MPTQAVLIKKIDGPLNVSDLLTKSVTFSTLRRLLSSPLISLDLSKATFVDRKGEIDVDTVNWSFSRDTSDADVVLIKVFLI